MLTNTTSPIKNEAGDCNRQQTADHRGNFRAGTSLEQARLAVFSRERLPCS